MTLEQLIQIAAPPPQQAPQPEVNPDDESPFYHLLGWDGTVSAQRPLADIRAFNKKELTGEVEAALGAAAKTFYDEGIARLEVLKAGQ